MKRKYFHITKQYNKLLNWFLGGVALFPALSFLGNLANLAFSDNGLFLHYLQTFIQSKPGSAIIGLLSVVSQLGIFEIFRRCLNKDKSKIHYAVLLLMIFLGLQFLIVDLFQPDVFASTNSSSATYWSQFQHNYAANSSFVTFLITVVLSISLMVKYTGRLLSAGISLIASPVLMFVSNGVLYYLVYKNVLSGSTYMHVNYLFSFISYILTLLPFLFVRRSMSEEVEISDGKDSDLGQDVRGGIGE